MSDEKTFAEWLQNRLDPVTRLRPSQLRRYTGLSESGISAWKRGKGLPEPEQVHRLADYFGADEDYLLYLAGHRRRWERLEDPVIEDIHDLLRPVLPDQQRRTVVPMLAVWLETLGFRVPGDVLRDETPRPREHPRVAENPSPYRAQEP